MIVTLAALLRISLRRTSSAWPIVLAAGVTCLLATTLLASGPIYADAVSVAGLHRVIADAPVSDANIQVSMRAEPDAADEVDAAVTAELARTVGELGGVLTRFGRSETFDLPGVAAGPVEDLVEIGFADGLEDVASLVAGKWPTDQLDPSSGSDPADPTSGLPVSVVVAEQVADPLGLEVGDILRLDSRIDRAFAVPVRIDGIVRIDDPADPFWWGDPGVLDGVVTTESFATHGPFFTTRAQFLGRTAVRRLELGWRAFPDVTRLSADGIEAFRIRVEGLHGRLTANDALGGRAVGVETALPRILADAERSLLVSRTGVLVLVIQLAIVAAYAVLLSATLLVDHRRVDTAMLRSRGASPATIALMATSEGLLLTIPAALLGPVLAVVALRAFNVVGPLADIGLRIEPGLSQMAFVASTAGAVACLLALVIPALPSRRSFASTRSGLARAETRPAGQRFGLDLALLAVAAIGLWQLRFYGAPLTESVQGTLGIDPLLVAAPAIGLLAGAVLALRLLPWLASAIERTTSRGRGLVSSLGARQIARRPLRYTRAALLLMLAISMGVFAVSYAWTWTSSQQDQATFQVGADIRVTPGNGSRSLPEAALGPAYDGLPGVAARMPVDRAPIRASRVGTGELIALDAVVAPQVVTIRPDLHDAPMDVLMAPLAAGRPNVDLIRLPDGTRQLRLDVQADIRSVERPVFDEELGQPVNEPVDPSEVAGHDGLRPAVVIRDGSGLLHRFAGAPVPLDGRAHEVAITFGPQGSTDIRSALEGPLALLGVEASVTVPAGLQIADGGTRVLRADTTISPDADVGSTDWQPLELRSAGAWQLTSSVFGQPRTPVEMTDSGPGLTAETGAPGLAVLPGMDRYGRGTTLSFIPMAVDRVGGTSIPALVTTSFLEATGRDVGDTIGFDVAGVRRTFEITDSIAAFPTVDAGEPALIADLPTITLLRYAGSGLVEPAAEWWLHLDDDLAVAQATDLVETLSADPIGSRAVVSQVDRARELSTDPVALGIIGALGIGFVAAALFAIVGFTVSAGVSARERVTEFALLRALGLSPRQLSRWLSMENIILAAVSLIAGTALGLLIAWIVLPFVSVTRDARTPYPPVALDVPWSLVGGLVLVGLMALAIVIFVLSRLLRRAGLMSAVRMTDE